MKVLLSTHANRHVLHISFTVSLCVCVFVRLRIYPARIKLAASDFEGWFRGVLGREFAVLSQKPKIGRIGAQQQVLLIYTPDPFTDAVDIISTDLEYR